MSKTIFVWLLGAFCLTSVFFAEAQQPKLYRVGVITSGGARYATIDGLGVGLRELGLEDGKQFVLEIRDTKGDAKAAEETAKKFEQKKVNLIYTIATSVTSCNQAPR